MKLIIATLIAVCLLCSVLHAKCPLSEAVISGTVVNSNKSGGIGNAKLLFFFDDASQFLQNGYASSELEYVSTNSSGIFKATAFYDTFSSSFFGSDKCESIPSELTVIVIAPGHTAQRFVHQIKHNELVPQTERLEIHLPIFQLK